MSVKVKGITEQTIKSYWTIFILVFIFLVIIGLRIWINVGHIPQTPVPIIVEGDLKPPRIMIKKEPDYPEEAKKAGIKGDIILEVHTDLDGNVKSAKVLNIDPDDKMRFGIWRLYRAAREAVLQWRFEPYNYRGEIKEAVFQVTVTFE